MESVIVIYWAPIKCIDSKGKFKEQVVWLRGINYDLIMFIQIQILKFKWMNPNFEFGMNEPKSNQTCNQVKISCNEAKKQ